jgi:hypothetical protein
MKKSGGGLTEIISEKSGKKRLCPSHPVNPTYGRLICVSKCPTFGSRGSFSKAVFS